ncbi:MAG: 3-dehydroquinate synthase, partial [Candidatus Omnitrophica bacterium]|nr:3-dehydroquinate synthase [Candidatus Omnitrophota bacterium]
GIRAALNYGHTIGHAIEAASGYRGKYNHGEAVAIGMVAAAHLSNKLGMLSDQELSKIKALIKRAGLPVKIKNIRFSKIWAAQLHDKKFVQGVNAFVLPVKIGKVAIVKNVPKDLVQATIRELIA